MPQGRGDGGLLKKHIARIVLGLAVVALFLGHTVGIYTLPLLGNLEAIGYDIRLRLTMPGGVDPRIVIVDIDEKSLAEKDAGGEGHWPWPRDRLALLLDKLFDRHGAAVVAFDVVFAERDESSGIRVLERLGSGDLHAVPQFQAALRRIRPTLEYDDIFARKMKGRNVVLGYTFSSEGAGVAPKKGALPPPILPKGAFGARRTGATRWSGYTGNLRELQSAAKAGGHFNPYTDPDGVTRRVPMLAEYDGAYYEPLSLAVVRSLLGSPALKVIYGEESLTDDYIGIEYLDVGSFRIPVDEHLTAMVPYRGGYGSFKYYSVVDVLQDRVPPDALRGKIVLVGTTAPGLKDLRATPVDPVYPGVEVHANLIAGILDQNIKEKPSYVIAVEATLLALSGIALTVLFPLLNPVRATIVAVAALAATVAVNAWIFDAQQLVLPLVSGLAMIAMLFVLNMAYGFFVEARGKRQITGLFGQYVPPQLVNEMARDPARFSMKGESRDMTVLFSDVRGFTTISEGLDPKALSELMNEFLTPLTEVIYRHRGTIDKYMGDCIMAFWGAPVPDPDHARNAILAGLDMQQALRELQPRFRERNWPEIHIGVGINTGRMSVGNMGSRIRLAYTVMGDAVNLASRLEGITKEYGADIIVGEDTHKAVPDIVYLELDRVRVKGKDVAVAIYEPLGLQGQVDAGRMRERELFHEALALYRAQRWDEAEAAMRRLSQGGHGAKRCAAFLERIAYLRAHPPGLDWDGAFTFTTK
jgi:adenylate cyclase